MSIINDLAKLISGGNSSSNVGKSAKSISNIKSAAEKLETESELLDIAVTNSHKGNLAVSTKVCKIISKN
jgi:hypothetical protein